MRRQHQKLKGGNVLTRNRFTPYASTTWIRLKGIISARTFRAPPLDVAKIWQKIRESETFLKISTPSNAEALRHRGHRIGFFHIKDDSRTYQRRWPYPSTSVDIATDDGGYSQRRRWAQPATEVGIASDDGGHSQRRRWA